MEIDMSTNLTWVQLSPAPACCKFLTTAKLVLFFVANPAAILYKQNCWKIKQKMSETTGQKKLSFKESQVFLDFLKINS